MALLKFALILAPLVIYYLYRRLYYLRFQQYASFPQLPSNLLFGHLLHINTAMNAPGKHPGRHSDMIFYELAKSAGHPPLLLFDMRPINYVLCLVTSHGIAEQLSRPSPGFKYGMYKSPTFNELYPLIGHQSLLVQEGEVWKRFRKMFNPGFAPAHLMTLLPKILEKTMFFVQRLDKAASSGEVLNMDAVCVDLTFDIIGSVVLDVDLNAQLSGLGVKGAVEDPIMKNMRYLLEAYENMSPVGEGPIRTMKRTRRSKGYDQAIKNAILERFREVKRQRESTASGQDKSRGEKGRSVVALALQDQENLTPESLQEISDQVRTFIFAGHDTTSSTLQWAFYELSRSPSALAKVCKELDDVLGPNTDPRAIADTLLARGEEAISHLIYLSAVLKEILRLYPAAGGARMAPKGSGFRVHDEEGHEWCVDGIVLYNCHFVIGRDPKVYGADAEHFVPERWLAHGDVDTSGKTYEDADSGAKHSSGKSEKGIPPSAWRPFERGPRSCIGQELANLEARVILASTVRRYRFEKVGMGALDLGIDGKPSLDEWGQYRTVDELVNRRQITAKPLDGMPMRIHIG